MFGTTLYENPEEYYVEFLLCDEQAVRVVVCMQYGNVSLYRVEWMRGDDCWYNEAAYTLIDAITLFREKIAEHQDRQEYQSQEDIEHTRNGYGAEQQEEEQEAEDWYQELNSNYLHDLGIRSPRLY